MPLTEDRSRTVASANCGAKDLRSRFSLGAASWFDLLGKLIVVCLAVKPKEKSGTEAPKEPQA